MNKLVVHEVIRWSRALALPVGVFAAIVLGPAALPAATALVRDLLTDDVAAEVWSCAAVAVLAWLVVAATRPRRDQRAAEHLQDLRVRAGLPDHALLCVLQVLWTSPAGQRVVAVDVRTGDTRDFWLTESNLGPGTYALIRSRAGVGGLVDIATPAVIAAACSHDRLLAGPAESRTTRRVRRAGADVVNAAESLLR